ncbi:MAG: thiol-disulfide oxidoreductase DCC family protein [Nannocystaceae bacterium]|nr:DCC1-like thiol-disulfide oxidoreductase family protein [bacterium]
MTDDPQKVLFYDGECVLCNRSVQLTIRLDRKARLRHAALQGATAKRLLGDLSPEELLSGVTLYDRGEVFRGWRAIAKVGGILFPWLAWGYHVLRVPPLPWLLDRLYAFVGRNRYRWFGQYDSCALPPAQWRDRYIVD